MINKSDAILSLQPNAEFVVSDSELRWLNESVTQPTTSEINAEVARLQAIYDNNEYQRTRADAYPELKEQLDLLYHDMAADKGDKTGEWFKAVKAVKDANAKPS
jgi:hypothetical protein